MDDTPAVAPSRRNNPIVLGILIVVVLAAVGVAVSVAWAQWQRGRGGGRPGRGMPGYTGKIDAKIAMDAKGTVGQAAPTDWPQWRGPARDNVSQETGLLKEWPGDGPKLVWKAKGVGGGYSSVSVAAGQVYTMGEDAQATFVHAIDGGNGNILWSAKVGGSGGGGGYPGPRATPTVDGKNVYALGQFGDLVCVDAATGKERWRKHLADDFGGQMMSGWGYSESVLVDGDRVICTPGGNGGTLLALNKESGKEIWRSKKWTDAAAYASAVPAEIGGVKQYVQLAANSVAGIAADDGRLLWRANRPGQTAVIPSPIVRDGYVFVTSGYNVGCNLFMVTPLDGGKFDVEEVYSNKEMKSHIGGVTLVGDHVYGSDDPGIFKCMEFETGKEVWKERELGKGALTSADGMIYFRSQDAEGTVTLLEATPEGFREKGSFTPAERTQHLALPAPVVSGGKLYIRDQDNIVCYDVKGK